MASSARLDDERWSDLSRELGRAAARVVPSWTDANSHDPGLSVLALLAHLTEQLGYRRDTLGPAALARLRALASDAALWAAGPAEDGASASAGAGDDCPPGLRRLRYFSGQLLGADDLQVEQDYVVARLNRRNRLLHGEGVVDGLDVTVAAGIGDTAAAVLIAPGLAFDRLGREIEVDAPCRLDLPADGPALWVGLRFAEQPCRPVPAFDPAAPSDPTADAPLAQPTHIVETFAAALSAAPDADAVTVARVHRLRGRWRVDARFEPRRPRR
jgi:hypothetical protein